MPLEQQLTSREWKPICSCSETVPPKDCMLHSCPCLCDMSISHPHYEYYHSDLKDRYTLAEYIEAESAYIEDYKRRMELYSNKGL